MHRQKTDLHRYRRLALIVAVLAWLAPAAAGAEQIDVTKERDTFSMEFRDADLKDVLRAVGQAAELNLVVSDAVTGQVSLSIKNVDIWDALEAVLRTKGLTYVREGNIVRVLSAADARDEDMETRVIPLGYASGKDVLAVVEKVKSEKAKISADTRINALVVKDLSLNLDKMERLLKNLDARIPQVLIEAKIIEVASNYAQEFGIQWGGKYKGTNHGNTTISGGSTGQSSGSAGTGTPPIGSTILYPSTGDIGGSGNAYIVNLPASVGPGSGGSLGLTFGSLGGRLTLDLQLSAMQATGNGKILSNPKVMTVNNKEAKISSGVDIPVKVVSSTAVGSTAEVKTISASLALSTTPTITKDNRIAMIVKVEKSEPDFSQEVDGIPTITKRFANSELVVNNGETVVLGGIYTKSEGQSEAGVPFLSKIPILGWLFKKKSSFDNQSELLIFLTPTIITE